MQTFEYPNLLNVSTGHVVLSTANLGRIPSVVCHGDPVVGDFYRMTLSGDLSSWGAYINITNMSAVANVPEGTRIAISLLARINGKPYHATPNLRLVSGSDYLMKGNVYSAEDVGGGGRCARQQACAAAWRTRAKCSTPRCTRGRRQDRPSTSRSRWCASRTSPTPGRRRKVRCGHERR